MKRGKGRVVKGRKGKGKVMRGMEVMGGEW